MKKEAIIDLIKNDLDEMKALVETFREPDRIATDFLDLLKQKHESTGKEILLLKYWSTENLISETTPSLEVSVASERKEEKPVRRAVKEPQKEITKITPTRPEIEDYFSAELEEMGDPFEGLTIGKPAGDAQNDYQTNNKEEEIRPEHNVEVATEEPAETLDSKSTAQPVQTPEPVAYTIEPEKEPEPVASPQTQSPAAPQKAKASAADIANYGTPVSDVARAIGINDRFLYQRELFKGNKMAFDAAIETINAASSYEQAYQYLKQSFNWDETDPTVEAFLKAVHRRFL